MVKTYFIRHTPNFALDGDTRKTLWDQGRIAIHYPHDKQGALGELDNSSLDPENYSKAAKGAMRAMRELADQGGYVWAEHWPQTEIMIGAVAPLTAIELIPGRWSDSDNRPAVLKTLQLTKIRRMHPASAPSLMAARPQQLTICHWQKCNMRVEDLVEGIIRPLRLEDLLASEQETMCAEFLRLAEAQEMGLPRLASLLVRVGGTLKDVDIVGMSTAGERIIGQVTYTDVSASAAKRDDLESYARADGSRVLLFCNAPKLDHQHGIAIVPLAKVFAAFAGTPTGRQWIGAIRPAI